MSILSLELRISDRISVGAVISGLGFALMVFVESLLGFYVIYGVILSIGMSAMLYIPAWTVIARWFIRRLSLALGILAVGAGLGGLLCAPGVAYLITHYGWRLAFVVLGVTIWVVVIPLAMVVRNRPEDMGDVSCELHVHGPRDVRGHGGDLLRTPDPSFAKAGQPLVRARLSLFLPCPSTPPVPLFGFPCPANHHMV